MTKDLARLLEAALPAGAEWASLRRVRSVERSYSARDGKFDAALVFEDEGYMIELLSGGQFGYAATASADPAALRRAAERALALAKAASPLALARFSPAVRPAWTHRWETPRAKSDVLGADLLAGAAVAMSAAMRLDPRIIQTTAAVETRDIEVEIVSTSGAALEQVLHLVSTGKNAVAREGNVVQNRSGHGPRGEFRQAGSEFLDLPALEEAARKTAREALELLAAEDCPSMTGDLVLAPDQMMLQIHESVGHPCELDRILGDERNYAGSTFVKLEDIGKLRYGSELMNVTFDPSLAGEAASYGFDDTGAEARKEFIVEKGVLVRALGGLESQARSGKPGVADQRAEGWRRPPVDRMANLNLEPGDSTFAEIVASVERGVYMEANRSWSIDDFRNKFQFGCEYGRLIEDGKLGRVVRNPNYRGISSSFWRNLRMVGDRSTFEAYGTPNCGKAEPNQVQFVGHASPTCAFRGVEIFGGEA